MIKDKKNLIIIGAGELGRELESWFELFSDDKDLIRIKGFLDDNLNAFENYYSDYRILGRILEYSFKKDDLAIIAISNPQIKEKIYNLLKEKVNFYTFIPKNAIVGKFVKIEEGCILTPNVILTTNIKLGKGIIINIGSQIGHDVVIDDFSSIMANVDLAGRVQLGKRVFVGSNAAIIPNLKIADDSYIGAGSIVIRSTKTADTVFGNPAKKL